MTVSLSPQDAARMIEDITQKKNDAVQKLGQISDAQEQMLSANWHGDSASSYQSTAQAQREEFDDIVKTLTHTVEVASGHLTHISSADQG